MYSLLYLSILPNPYFKSTLIPIPFSLASAPGHLTIGFCCLLTGVLTGLLTGVLTSFGLWCSTAELQPTDFIHLLTSSAQNWARGCALGQEAGIAWRIAVQNKHTQSSARSTLKTLVPWSHTHTHTHKQGRHTYCKLVVPSLSIAVHIFPVKEQESTSVSKNQDTDIWVVTHDVKEAKENTENSAGVHSLGSLLQFKNTPIQTQ